MPSGFQTFYLDIQCDGTLLDLRRIAIGGKLIDRHTVADELIEFLCPVFPPA